MIVQEQGVAVGWPLNLGHDTTGWPLGLRLRLLHDDLKWPRKPELAHSSSDLSTDSSSLDTKSTRSEFFQDNSKSLGTLIGLPMQLDGAGNPVLSRHQQQHQRPHRRPPSRGSSSAARPNFLPASSSVLQDTKSVLKPRANARRRRSSAKQLRQQHLSASSTVQGISSVASNAGWSLLSALSCARVPAAIGAAENEDYEETAIPRTQLVAREVPSRSSAQEAPELEPEGNHGTPVRSALPHSPRNSPQQQLNSLAKKFYDNITFEDEEPEICNRPTRRSISGPGSSDCSAEWNPLFVSSPQAARDEESKHEVEKDNDKTSSGRRAGTMTTMCDQLLVQRASFNAALPLMTILGRSNTDYADALLYCHKDSSRLRIGGCPTTFSVDVGKWQQKQKQLGEWRSQLVSNTKTAREDSQFISHHPARESLKSKAVAAFIYRMVCCTPQYFK